MNDTIFVLAMFGTIVVVTLIVVPSLFRRKCRVCKHRNKLDTDVCEKCGARL